MSNYNYYNSVFQILCITIIIYELKNTAHRSLKRITIFCENSESKPDEINIENSRVLVNSFPYNMIESWLKIKNYSLKLNAFSNTRSSLTSFTDLTSSTIAGNIWVPQPRQWCPGESVVKKGQKL